MRLIDATLNRGREGLRVIEDGIRFLFDDESLLTEIKEIRHKISVSVDLETLLQARDTEEDVGTGLEGSSEGARQSVEHVILVNFKRVQEALRVLEEYSKVVGLDYNNFKAARYQSYTLEKKFYEKYKTNK